MDKNSTAKYKAVTVTHTRLALTRAHKGHGNSVSAHTFFTLAPLCWLPSHRLVIILHWIFLYAECRSRVFSKFNRKMDLTSPHAHTHTHTHARTHAHTHSRTHTAVLWPILYSQEVAVIVDKASPSKKHDETPLGPSIVYHNAVSASEVQECDYNWGNTDVM